MTGPDAGGVPDAGGLEIEVLGRDLVDGRPDLPLPHDIERLIALAIATAGVDDGHVALTFVAADAIAALNAEHRGTDGPTDVLSFPVDEASEDVAGPRELGDIVICAPHTVDIREAIVHGALHLVGMDHETDDGEMLSVQAEILSW